MDLDGYIFDYRTGCVRAGCELPGFDVLGADGAPDGRVVTLGGCTTPEMARNKNSWADDLHRLFSDSGGDIQLLNGCTDGYAAAQEMTLFVRDVILLKPRLVICLSGFHDFAYKLGFVRDRRRAAFLKTHPFATPRQMAFLEKIASRFGLGKDEVYYGEENNTPAHAYWLGCMEIINCLCEEFGIRFAAFLQPCVFSGDYRMGERETGMIQELYNLTDSEIEGFRGEFRREYADAARLITGREYITDLSALFDGERDAYAEACRPRDCGSLAGAVYTVVKTMSGLMPDGGILRPARNDQAETGRRVS
jgi:hypothetical protein